MLNFSSDTRNSTIVYTGKRGLKSKENYNTGPIGLTFLHLSSKRSLDCEMNVSAGATARLARLVSGHQRLHPIAEFSGRVAITQCFLTGQGWGLKLVAPKKSYFIQILY